MTPNLGSSWRRATVRLLLVPATITVGGCMDPPDSEPPLAEGVFARLGEPLPSATAEQVAAFERGRAVSLRRFDRASGLGPDFNVTFCTGCHERPVAGGSAGLYRNFFLSGTVTNDGAFVTGDFGGVIRRNRVPVEGNDDLQGFFPGFPDTFPTSERFTAQRNPIPFFGAGLLAEISGEEIASRADPDDADGDGISGRINIDVGGFVARFGRKAQVASIEGFIRGPLNNHLGITSDPLTDEQRANLPVDSSLATVALARIGAKPTVALQAAAPDGPLTDRDGVADPELSGEDLFDLVSFVMLMAAPEAEAPTDQSERGRSTFGVIGCTGCHVARINGPRGALPVYSDLLVHDMGADLADGLVQGEAGGNEFRTQPLWGIASVGPYLHDGRATTLEDAVLAHGGEGKASRDAFAALSDAERGDVVEFMMSLGGRSQASDGLLPPDSPIPDVGEFGGPFRALTDDEQARFISGRAVFDFEFTLSTGVGALAPDGQAARFNGDSCRACHFEPTLGGAGPAGVNVMRHGRVDADGVFSAPTTTPNTILHTQSRDLEASNLPEDGINVFEPRQPPHTFGLGLIDAIADETIMANADEFDEDGDGISGRAHVIVDAVGTRVGRLGWKAQAPNIGEFVRDAMAAEVGLTLPAQEGLIFGLTEDDDGVADPELTLQQVEDVAFFLSMLGGPPRQGDIEDPLVVRGAAVFEVIHCDSCHIPTLTAMVDGAAMEVPLYSDLLLHDILPAGTAGIEDGLAGQGEFRTSPLWGVSATAPYMHNGMADTIDEAIRLHDGEAVGVVAAYLDLDEADRSSLIDFLESL